MNFMHVARRTAAGRAEASVFWRATARHPHYETPIRLDGWTSKEWHSACFDPDMNVMHVNRPFDRTILTGA